MDRQTLRNRIIGALKLSPIHDPGPPLRKEPEARYAIEARVTLKKAQTWEEAEKEAEYFYTLLDVVLKGASQRFDFVSTEVYDY